MAIKTKVETSDVSNTDTYPKLRKWKGDRIHAVHGPLVVLFLTPTTGVALSGVHPERVGQEETWATLCDMDWETTTITVSSAD